MGTVGHVVRREPLNKGKLVGQKAPFKITDIWVRMTLIADTHSRLIADSVPGDRGHLWARV